jgi:hypothetical protein
MTFGVGVGVGIGIGFYGRYNKQAPNFFDPDTDPDPDVYRTSSTLHRFDLPKIVLGQSLQPRRFGEVKQRRKVSRLKPRPT